MLLDFFKMVVHPDHYRSAWRDGDFIVEFAPDSQDEAPEAETHQTGKEAAVLDSVDVVTEPAE